MLDLLKEMAENSQSMVTIVNIHQSKIDVVKFDGTNNFGMWRCDVMNVLTTSNLDDAILLERMPEESSDKN